jgi:ribonuclease D
LQIFFANYGCTARHVFDTQIAAAFLGYGHQPVTSIWCAAP